MNYLQETTAPHTFHVSLNVKNVGIEWDDERKELRLELPADGHVDVDQLHAGIEQILEATGLPLEAHDEIIGEVYKIQTMHALRRIIR